jgi:hypothetical protein
MAKWESAPEVKKSKWETAPAVGDGVNSIPSDISLQEALLPNSLEYLKAHPEEMDKTIPSGKGFRAGLKDLGKDILSVPKGLNDYVVGKIGQKFGGEDPGTLAQNIASKGSTVVDKALRDPGTGLTLPFGGEFSAAAKGIPAIGKGIIGKVLTGGARMSAEGAMQGATAAEVNGENPVGGAAMGAALAPVIGGALHIPGTIGKIVRGTGKAAGDLLPGTSEEVATLFDGKGPLHPNESNKFGIQLSPAQAAGETEGVRPALELMAQTNPYLQDIPGKLSKANEQAIPSAVLSQRKGLPNAPASLPEISPSAVGGRIDEAARAAKQGIGEQFAAAQDQALHTAGDVEIPPTKAGLKNNIDHTNTVAETPLPTRTAQNANKNGGKFYSRPLMVDEVEKTLKGVGYDDKKGFTGNEQIGRPAIQWLREQEDLLSNAKNTEDLLAQKRRIGREIYDGGRGDTPLFNDKDKAVLSGFERRIDEHLSAQFEEALQNGQMTAEAYKAARNLWSAQNAEYSNNRHILEAVDRGLGISSAKSNAEGYMAKIKNIGVDKLGQLKAAAEQSDNIRPLYQEMQAGFFDNFLKNSINNKTMNISPDKLLTNWNAMDPGLKQAMVPERVISEMNEIVDLVGKSRLNNPYTVNPSGTGKLTAMLGAIRNPEQAIPALLFRGPLKEYYATGHAPSLSSILNVVDKVQKGSNKVAGAAEGVQRFLSLPSVQSIGTRTAIIGAQE